MAGDARLLEASVPAAALDAVLAGFGQFAGYHPAEAHRYLPLLGVDPARQGHGYGAALLRHGYAGRGRVVRYALTPVRAPRANAIAERVGRTRRNDGLEHVLPLHEARLHEALTEYVAYDNSERPHRVLVLLPPLPRAPTTNGPIRRRPVPGGLPHVCESAA